MTFAEAARYIADRTHFSYDEVVGSETSLVIYDDYFQDHELLVRVSNFHRNLSDVLIDWVAIGRSGLTKRGVCLILDVIKAILKAQRENEVND